MGYRGSKSIAGIYNPRRFPQLRGGLWGKSVIVKEQRVDGS